MTRVGIIGAGPGGLTAAARLADHGFTVEVFEASTIVGGMSRSLSLWGRDLDLSAHIFLSQDPFVDALWREMAGEMIQLSLRRAIFDGKKTIAYPLSPLQIARHLSPTDLLSSALGLGASIIRRPWTPEATNAEEWMIRHYGRRLHELFLRDYAEKLWGTPCDKIDARFTQFLFYSADRSQEGEQQFQYPLKGSGSVWNQLSDSLAERGVGIHLDAQISEILVDGYRIAGLAIGDQTHKFDHLVSTMPLGLLARMLFPEDSEVRAAGEMLRARSSILVYLLATEGTHNNYNWVSIYPSSYQIGRFTDFGRWSDHGDDNTVYCLEFWCDTEDEMWNRSDEELISLASQELNETGLVGTVVISDGHVERLANSHPVFTVGFQSAIDHINTKVKSLKGITSLGRLGEHGVLGMGETMEAARLAADKIAKDLPSRETPITE